MSKRCLSWSGLVKLSVTGTLLVLLGVLLASLMPGQRRPAPVVTAQDSLSYSPGQSWLGTESPVLGTTATLICPLSVWVCRDVDLTRPELHCCHDSWAYPTPSDSACLTNQDPGQKDGTGFVGHKRRYPFFDYEQDKVLQIPPTVLD